MSTLGSPGDHGRFREAIAAIDALNAEDPSMESSGEAGDTAEAPAALLYGRHMSAWILRLAPDASEGLRLAARAQHIGRWKMPRDSYPQGREGYLDWRAALARFHAETAGRILADAGYGPAVIDRVGDLLRKKRLKRDAEVQTLEDAACLVFLETQLVAFAAKHPDDKVVDILRKTALKMSARGLAEAARLAEHLPEKSRALIARALS